jgi:hypothetical protein
VDGTNLARGMGLGFSQRRGNGIGGSVARSGSLPGIPCNGAATRRAGL